MSYADQRYGAVKTLVLQGQAAAGTSLYSADQELDRVKFMSAVEILDFNVVMTAGATYTSGDKQIAKIGKSLAGTGAIADLGTADVAVEASGAIIDGNLTTSGYYAGTANHVAAGDTLVYEIAAGTAKPTEEPQYGECWVSYRERFAEGDSV